MEVKWLTLEFGWKVWGLSSGESDCFWSLVRQFTLVVPLNAGMLEEVKRTVKDNAFFN